jgi:hypothetical protein
MLRPNHSLPPQRRRVSHRTLDKLIPTENVGTDWKVRRAFSPPLAAGQARENEIINTTYITGAKLDVAALGVYDS